MLRGSLVFVKTTDNVFMDPPYPPLSHPVHPLRKKFLHYLALGTYRLREHHKTLPAILLSGSIKQKNYLPSLGLARPATKMQLNITPNKLIALFLSSRLLNPPSTLHHP